ncbi:MAG: cell division protein FtsQ/DivIB [Eubacteriales bacterium]|nr:cell division protein FtsQ/DivIB [Eubacteriales bacterium]
MAVTVILIILIGISLLFFLRVKNIEVRGNKAYSKEEIVSMVFPEETDRSLLMILYREKTGKHRTFPFIISYQVHLTGADSCKVIVYEKKPIGYVSYMGSRMYFDKDGIVIESTGEELEGVPEVTGLRFGKIVLDRKLEADGSAVFEKILNISSQTDAYQIPLRAINIDDTGNITLTLSGGVRVKLGNDDAFPEKLSLLNDVYDKLKDRKGIADLSGYSDLHSDGFSFVPDE